MSLVHDLTVGYLDADALRQRIARSTRPLDDAVVDRVLAEFPGLQIERHDGYLIVPWHGREDGARGEAFASRIQEQTGCMVADRRNGRVVVFSRTASRSA